MSRHRPVVVLELDGDLPVIEILRWAASQRREVRAVPWKPGSDGEIRFRLVPRPEGGS